METISESTGKAPEVSQDFIYQMALHLHRYLAPWLDGPGRPSKLWAMVGFARTETEALTYQITPEGATRIDVPWGMDALLERVEFSEGGTPRATPAPLAAPEPGIGRLGVMRLGESGERSSRAPDGPLGFVLVEATALGALPERALGELRERAAEAIRAGRRNSVRLTLEAAARSQGRSIKAELYDVLHHLPEWLGVDHSASLMVTHDVADMVRLGVGDLDLDDAPSYDVMAERLFFDEPTARLIGMTVPVEGAGRTGSGLLACALRRQAQEPDRRYHRFMPTRRPSDHTRTLWVALDAMGEHVQGLSLNIERPAEGRVIYVPLISAASDDVAPELLGWLRLAWRQAAYLPASTGPTLRLIADTLAARLRGSSLYTLSARQLLLLEKVRDDLTDTLAHPTPGQTPADAFLGRVIARVAASTGLPSLSIGQVRGQTLWFANPHGWTEDQDPTLPLDDPERSGVVGLAVRLRQPVVLSGGSDDEHQKAWKNTAWVHEGRRLITDDRHHDSQDLAQPGWRRLASYYQSAHGGTYATLAYPILFGPETLGVIAVEVERRTTWLWWSGIGSRIFWRLLAAEIAMALKLLTPA